VVTAPPETAPRGPLPQSHGAVDAFVDEARRRQDALVAQVRLLAADSRALEDGLRRALAVEDSAADPSATVDADAPRRGLLSSLSRRLKARRPKATPAPTRHVGEDVLRERVEAAVQESKRASWLADRLAALRHDLDDEARALRSSIEHAGTEAEACRERMRTVAIDAGPDADAVAAAATRQATVLDTLHDRLHGLVAQAKGVADIVDTLHADVAAFAAAAAEHTDALAARARAVGVAEDASVVLDELHRALHHLGGGLDEAAAFARAVHERIGHASSSDPAFQASLQTLVQGALARRAAQDAREKAQA